MSTGSEVYGLFDEIEQHHKKFDIIKSVLRAAHFDEMNKKFSGCEVYVEQLNNAFQEIEKSVDSIEENHSDEDESSASADRNNFKIAVNVLHLSFNLNVLQ